MAIEHASVQVVHKPWGSDDLRPWSDFQDNGDAIGELWFQRADVNAPDPALLVKLLFTTEPLSIQVHPDDAFAQANGMVHGKTEVWYILSAAPDSRVAVGLKRQLTAPQLRASIEDGSIADLVQWRVVRKDDVVLVPAGTIHAIGAGLVVAEIQQRSDVTYRLYDYGRQRELHVDSAVAAARVGPAGGPSVPRSLCDARTLLVAGPPFVLERIDLAPNSHWELQAEHEFWVLVIKGRARIGPINAFVGEGIFLEADRTVVVVGSEGLIGLCAYPGLAPSPSLLRNLDFQNAGSPIYSAETRP